MKLNLQMKLIGSYVLLSLFLVSSLLLISNYALESQFQEYILEQQEKKNREVVDAVLEEFKEKGKPSQEFLASIGQHALKQGLILMVNDYSGQELFCMSKINSNQCSTMLESMKETMDQRFINWQGEYKEKVYLLAEGENDYGTVTLGYHGPFYYNDLDVQFIDMLNKLYWGAAIVFLVIAIAMGCYIAKRISNPIEKVTEKTRAIQRGQYDDRINMVSSTAEIHQLIGCINNLAESLEQQQRIKKRMANDYAHEFRTPLTTLQSNFEGMIDGVFEVTPQRLESCREEVIRLSKMVSEIDRIIEIENHPVTLEKKRFSVDVLVEGVLMNFHHEFANKGIEVEKELEYSEIMGDRDKLSQVIINLISNGIKYNDAGGKIIVQVKNLGKEVTLIIGDTGVGIEPEHIPHIFDYLYRVDPSRNRETGGSGIGLSIVKAIVDAHGGTIAVESEPTVGSKFIICLPKD